MYQVGGLLKADGYKSKGSEDKKAIEGDIVVFEDKESGKGAYSETVVQNDNGVVTVEGLGGTQTQILQKTVNKAWTQEGTKKRYYKKPEKDLKMSDKDIENAKKDLEKLLEKSK